MSTNVVLTNGTIAGEIEVIGLYAALKEFWDHRKGGREQLRILRALAFDRLIASQTAAWESIIIPAIHSGRLRVEVEGVGKDVLCAVMRHLYAEGLLVDDVRRRQLYFEVVKSALRPGKTGNQIEALVDPIKLAAGNRRPESLGHAGLQLAAYAK